MKPKILFINQYYYPDLASTGQLMTQLCESLSAEFEVTVLTGFPSYTKRQGKFPGLYKREMKGGVAVVRVYSTAFPRKILPLRIVNYLTFFLGSAIAALFVRRVQIIVTQTDPPVIGLIGMLVRMVKGGKHCAIFQDVFPEVAVALGKLKGPPISVLRIVRRLLLKRCDYAVSISSGMAKELQARGLHPNKSEVIANWIDTDLVRPQAVNNPFRSKQGWNDKLVVMHSGNIGLSQDFSVILQAAKLLRKEQDILFAIVGDGAMRDWVAEQIAHDQLKQVQLLPYQPLEQLGQSLGAADIHLVTLKPGLEHFIVPSKIYGIMGASRPVISLVPTESEVYDIVSKNEIGIALPPGDARGLADAILALKKDAALRNDMGRIARQLVESKYSLKMAAEHYRSLFNKMTSS